MGDPKKIFLCGGKWKMDVTGKPLNLLVKLPVSVCALACLFGFPLHCSASKVMPVNQAEVKPLKPAGGMPMWYYKSERIFRYPIPTNFEFAYIDKSGKFVITGPFSVAHGFSKGVALVRVGRYTYKNGAWKFSDLGSRSGQPALLFPDGSVVFAPLPEHLSFAFDDLVLVKTPAFRTSGLPHFGLADRTGKVLSSYDWETASDFSEGLIAVQELAEGRLSGLNGVLAGVKIRLYGYRDKDNRVVISPRFRSAGRFSEGLAAVSQKGVNVGRPGANDPTNPHYYHMEDFCYIDRTGKVVIPGPFMEAQPFLNGMAAVMQGGKWGFVDKNGKLVIPCQYDWAGDFKGSIAPVEKNLLVGYIDKSGKQVIPFKFKDGREFSQGLAPVTLDARRWGYINEKGEFAIEPQFQRAFPFDCNRALVLADTRKSVVSCKQELPYFYQSAQQARTSGDFNEARAICARVIAMERDGVWAQRARRLLETGLPDHDLSAEVCKLYKQGEDFAQADKLEQAGASYRKALALDSDFYMVAGSLAYVMTRQKRFDEAVTMLQRTLKKYPSYARGYWRLSQIYQEQGKPELAKENLARARGLDPDDPYFSP